ncbi:RNA polymerase ECF-subfamily sigma factor [Enhygromyxa salina]|uniref:RNA polymerase ECF-subfamily sigma factor n=1 Tax=Enhygromyxa salina TaxID=215803 RepID=A0A0C2D0A0_9BACT|nr:RNA polymerase sigma factor [Enhygromyxa salina]KIG16661.1 RNA polymerase ECF-subfamily sigma factor [Enhygromyxa salina]
MARAPSFDRLYRRHYDFVWRSALRLGVRPASLDDVVQETFLVAYRRRDEFEQRSKASTWLFSILVNVSRNHRRGRQRAERKHLALSEVCSALEPATRSGTELGAQRGLAIRLLAEFLVELDAGKREVFVLAELEGMRGREIAAALGLNNNTVHSRLRAARKAFEQRFEQRGPVPALCDQLRSDPPVAPSEERMRNRALILAALGPVESGAAASLGMGAWGWGLVAGLCLAGVALAWQLSSSATDPGPSSVADAPDPDSQARQPATVAAPVKDEAPAKPTQVQDEPSRVELPPALDAKPDDRGAQGSAGNTAARSEAEVFEAARSAMLEGRPRQALALVRRLDARGELAWERAVTEVGALCLLERGAEAEALADEWNRAHANRNIEAACW